MGCEDGQYDAHARDVADGCEARFRAALCKTLGVLRGRAMMIVGDEALADDLVQETAERALRARQRPRIEELQPWLWRILKNLVIDRWRAGASQRTCSLREEHAEQPVEELPDPWWHRVTLEEIHAAIRSLPTQFCELLLLQIDGCSYAELAERCGLKSATVGTRLFRGRLLLRRALERGCGAPEE